MTQIHMKSFARFLTATLWAAFTPAIVQAADRLDLAGQWRFALDRRDKGVAEQWFNRDLEQKIKLPGSLQERGFGDEVSVDTKWTGGIVDQSWFKDPQYAPYRQPGNVKIPFWLQPDKHYVGAAWYQREVEVPAAWAGRRFVLRFERAHWETTVWVDDNLIGSRNSLGTPHEFDLTYALTRGKHRVSVRVDNRMVVEVGVNSHSVSDHTQGNWNGLVGALEVRASDRVWLDDAQVYPDVANNKVKVVAAIGNLTRGAGSGVLRVSADSYNTSAKHRPAPKEVEVKWGVDGDKIEFEYDLGPGALRWDEFSPALYRLNVALDGRDRENRYRDEKQVSFGLREVKRSGTQIAVNGRKLFLRGTLECNIFPLTGYPPTDVESWKRIIRICQAHGLNHIRFHSHTPPAAAFQAADELGFYYYVECPSWANSGSSVGDGRKVDGWLYEEGERMLRNLGNHPSFIMMSYGNEPAGKNQNRWLGDFINHWKARDTRRLYTSGAGWPMIPENDFHVTPAPLV
jgi:beta-galactosidase/beta-glucuronidase